MARPSPDIDDYIAWRISACVYVDVCARAGMDKLYLKPVLAPTQMSGLRDWNAVKATMNGYFRGIPEAADGPQTTLVPAFCDRPHCCLDACSHALARTGNSLWR